jgi:uncharacterized protein
MMEMFNKVKMQNAKISDRGGSASGGKMAIQNSKFIRFIPVFLIIGLLVFYISIKKNPAEWPYVLLGGKKIYVELADTPEKSYQGLSDRDSMCADCGMLFKFPDYEERIFVMRRMKFPLDIIFIKDDTIEKIARNLPPEGEMPEVLYRSEKPVNFVLEVNAGLCDKNNIREGMKMIQE